MIKINNLEKEIGIRSLFSIEHLYIDDDDKIGLIGDNGAGKTALLKVISGNDMDYTGNVETDMRISTMLNDDERDDFQQESFYEAGLRYGDRYSPGENQRLRLSELLLDTHSFLLMDEPTSHLDIKEKERLMGRLHDRKRGFIMISHDRDFIDRTCNRILELSHGEVDVYNGNYSFYMEERLKRRKFQKREYESYISEKKRLECMVSEISEKSSRIRTTPTRMGNSEARLHKMGGQGARKKLDSRVKAVESRINQLEVKERPKVDTEIALTIPEKDRIFSRVLIKAEKLNKRFEDRIIFKDTNLEVENNRRIALLGENGSGKTTLLNMILNEEVWVHPNLKVGYYSQMGETIDSTATILENVIKNSIYDQSMTRTVLARLGFKTDDVYKKVDVLSDGERAKVKLARLITSDFNLLMMDEPTNFLDIRAIEALEGLLRGYDRPMIFVTHDVSFIDNVADSLLIIEDRKLKSFNGSYSEYRNTRAERRNTHVSDEQDMMTDFRMAAINSRLTQDISKEERERLEEEYLSLAIKIREKEYQ